MNQIPTISDCMDSGQIYSLGSHVAASRADSLKEVNLWYYKVNVRLGNIKQFMPTGFSRVLFECLKSRVHTWGIL